MHTHEGKTRLLAVLLLAVLCGAGLAAYLWQGGGEAGLRVTLLKVGKADAIVLQSGGSVMVLDTGETEDGDELAEFLRSQGAQRVDLLVITHLDKDHVGGAASLAGQLEVGRVLLPNYESDRPEYLAFLEVLAQKGVTPERLTAAASLSLGQAQLLIEPASTAGQSAAAPKEDNELSLVVTATHGQNRLLFMGDAESARIAEWLAGPSAGPCDFLKVPHHGRYSPALEDLLKAARPQYAAICSSQKNPAEQKTLALLRQYGAEVFETKDGDITLISDGQSLQISQ